MRLAEFEATSFAELEKRARKVGWNEVLAPGAPVRMRVTCKKSRLYHSDAVAQRVGDAIRLAVGAAATTAEGPEDADESDDQTTLIVVRFFRDQCTISADLSGALLHRRGYRLATAKAPIRETLAAALLLASGYDGSAPLLDPMCGSGTLPIEAAMIARRIAPGLQRAFAVERWPIHDAAAWREMRAAAAAAVLPHAPHVIAGSDRDAGAITASAANAKRAGVADDIVFSATPVSTMPVPAGRHGWIVVNPPYGVRVGERKPLRDLYAAFGRTMRTRAPGWTLAIVAAHPSLLAPLEVPLTAALSKSNGGIGVQFMTGTIPQGTA
jgi:putative N6-adenine-specific DNA methylase